MTPETLIVAMTIFMEAKGEIWMGKVMVADVIYNRARISGKTLAETCKAPKQFSCWNNPKRGKKLLRELKAGKYVNDQAWEHCLALTSMLCWPDYKTTTPATHYCNLDLCSPKWAKSMTLIAKVGKHTFFRENNANSKST